MLRPSTRRPRAILPWAAGPLLGLTAAAWGASRPPAPVPLGPAVAVGIVPGAPVPAAGRPGFAIQPPEVDPHFVVPKSAEIDPRIVVHRSAEIDPRIVAGVAAGPRGR